MDKYLNGIKILTIAEIVSKINVLILIPLLARYLGAGVYGVYGQLSIITAILTPLFILGIDFGIIRYMPGIDEEEQKSKFSGAVIFIIAFSIILLLGLIFLKSTLLMIFLKGQKEYFELITYVLFLAVTNSLINILKTWFRVKNDSINYSKILIISSLFNFSSIIAVVYIRGAVREIIQFRLIYELILIFWMLYLCKKNYGFGRPDFSVIKRYIGYGLPLMPGAYAMYALNYADRLVLVQNVSFAQIGIYTLAYNLGSLALQACTSPIMAMFPNLASEFYNQNDSLSLKQLFSKSVSILLYISIPLLIGSLALGENLIVFFGGSEYETGGYLIAVIVLGYLFLMLSSYYDVFLGLAQKQYLATISTAFACIFNLILNIIFIPIYGMYAAALITAAAFLSQFLLSYSFARRHLYIKMEVKTFSGTIVSAAIMGIVVGLSRIYLQLNNSISLFLNIGIGVVVYLLITWKLGIINEIKQEG